MLFLLTTESLSNSRFFFFFFFLLFSPRPISHSHSPQVSDAQRTFDWIDATLETYYVGSDCNKLPSGTLTYSNMALTVQNNGKKSAKTISWSGDETSACNGKLNVGSPTRVTIQHN